MRHGEFRDDRLAAVYDLECPWSRADDFFVTELAAGPAVDVLDLGCGTGRLATFLSTRGYRVTGVDPAKASLDLARGKPGAERVTWLDGSYEVLPVDAFDAALMTSHVAQFFVTDFDDALAALARALRPGGRLIFDSRDPAGRRWEKWNRADTWHRTADYETWTEVTSVVNGAVTFEHHYVFADGDVRLSTDTLRFRSESTLRSSLTAAGFTVDRIHGGWNRDPIGHPDGEFLVIAVLGYGFDQLGMHRIIARLDERNEASARVARRLGMRQEARLVDNEWFKGEWTTELDFALLATEWEGSAP